ncbi:chaperonin, mitochondrial [Glycine max]|nr:chaperonin, mitochondrial [Glycine max]
MAKRLIPLFNRVLVEKIVPPSKTTAGILLPEKSTKLNSGKVIAVGPGFHSKDGKLIPVAVKEGDTVLLPEYGGTEVKLDNKEYLPNIQGLTKFEVPLGIICLETMIYWGHCMIDVKIIRGNLHARCSATFEEFLYVLIFMYDV